MCAIKVVQWRENSGANVDIMSNENANSSSCQKTQRDSKSIGSHPGRPGVLDKHLKFKIPDATTKFTMLLKHGNICSQARLTNEVMLTNIPSS